jgi:hypothetical protein
MSGYEYNYVVGPYTSNGQGPNSSNWSKTSEVTDTEGIRKRPPYMPMHTSGSYITKTEIIEHVITPMVVSEYAAKVEPWKNYGVAEKNYGFADDDKWRRSSSPVKNYGATDEKWQTSPSGPVKGYGYGDEKLHRPSSPVKGYGYGDEKLRRPSSPVKDYGYADEKLRRPSSPVKGYGYADEKLRRPSSPVKNYGSTNEKWSDPSSPLKNYVYADDEKSRKPSSPVKKYGSTGEKWSEPSSPLKSYGGNDEKWRKPSSPGKNYGSTDQKLRRPSSPVKGYGPTEEKWRTNPSLGPAKDYGYADERSHNQDHYRRPNEVEEFITNVPTEASRPNKFVPMRATNWRSNNNNSNNNNGYGANHDNRTDPTLVTSGGWVRPTRTAWSSPPPPSGSLSSPTANIGAAVEMIKEAVKSSGPGTQQGPRYSVPLFSPRPNTNQMGYSGNVIDSREAAKRYGNLSSVPRPVENYTATIDSTEATRKYGGLRV